MPNIHGRYDRLKAHEEANKPAPDPLRSSFAKKRLLPKPKPPKKPLPPGGIPSSVGGGEVDNDEVLTGLKKRKTLKSRMAGIRGRLM